MPSTTAPPRPGGSGALGCVSLWAGNRACQKSAATPWLSHRLPRPRGAHQRHLLSTCAVSQKGLRPTHVDCRSHSYTWPPLPHQVLSQREEISLSLTTRVSPGAPAPLTGRRDLQVDSRGPDVATSLGPPRKEEEAGACGRKWGRGPSLRPPQGLGSLPPPSLSSASLTEKLAGKTRTQSHTGCSPKALISSNCSFRSPAIETERKRGRPVPKAHEHPCPCCSHRTALSRDGPPSLTGSIAGVAGDSGRGARLLRKWATAPSRGQALTAGPGTLDASGKGPTAGAAVPRQTPMERPSGISAQGPQSGFSLASRWSRAGVGAPRMLCGPSQSSAPLLGPLHSHQTDTSWAQGGWPLEPQVGKSCSANNQCQQSNKRTIYAA